LWITGRGDFDDLQEHYYTVVMYKRTKTTLIITIALLAISIGGWRFLASLQPDNRAIKVGSTGVLREAGASMSPDPNNIPVVSELIQQSLVLNTASAEDKQTAAQLIQQGKIFVVPTGTRVQLTDELSDSGQVRVLQLPSNANASTIGATGWVPIEWVSPE